MTPSCARCRWFETARDRIEAAVPGLTVLGSAYASVAGNDGLCRARDTIQSPRDRCAAFDPVRASHSAA